MNENATGNALKYFRNRVNRYYFCNKIHRNNVKVKRKCFLQKDHSNQKIHFRFIVILANNETDINFIKTLKRIWQYEVMESCYFSDSKTFEIKAVTIYLKHKYYKLDFITSNTSTAHLK